MGFTSNWIKGVYNGKIKDIRIFGCCVQLRKKNNMINNSSKNESNIEFIVADEKPEDEAQKELLKSLFDEDSIWRTWKVNLEEVTVGFVSIRIDKKAKVGEIGLNAVHPKYAKKGIGTQMYDFAVEIMRKEGMKVATVATGEDPSHLSARKAYRKAGFDVEIPSVWMCQVIE